MHPEKRKANPAFCFHFPSGFIQASYKLNELWAYFKDPHHKCMCNAKKCMITTLKSLKGFLSLIPHKIQISPYSPFSVSQRLHVFSSHLFMLNIRPQIPFIGSASLVQTSFYSVKLKYSTLGTRRKSHFCLWGWTGVILLCLTELTLTLMAMTELLCKARVE